MPFMVSLSNHGRPALTERRNLMPFVVSLSNHGRPTQIPFVLRRAQDKRNLEDMT
jgi:hypothetical protein